MSDSYRMTLVRQYSALCRDYAQTRGALEHSFRAISILLDRVTVDDALFEALCFCGGRTRVFIGACWYDFELSEWIIQHNLDGPTRERHRANQKHLAELAARALVVYQVQLDRETSAAEARRQRLEADARTAS